MQDFWIGFGKGADILSYITALITFTTLLLIYWERKRLQNFADEFNLADNYLEIIKENEGIKSDKPIALAISLVPTADSIKANVETFLKTKSWTMEILEINESGLNNAGDIVRFQNRLVEMKRRITNAGNTEIHLFIQAPVFSAVLVGSTFRNWIPVKIYHKPQSAPPQIYEYQTPLI
jgi:SMODS-associated and fused to various effectors sensor domain